MSFKFRISKQKYGQEAGKNPAQILNPRLRSFSLNSAAAMTFGLFGLSKGVTFIGFLQEQQPCFVGEEEKKTRTEERSFVRFGGLFISLFLQATKTGLMLVAAFTSSAFVLEPIFHCQPSVSACRLLLSVPLLLKKSTIDATAVKK